MKLQIVQDGFQRIHVPKQEQRIDIQVDKHTHASLLLTYSGIEQPLYSCVIVKEGASLTVLFKHEGCEPVYMIQEGRTEKDARLLLAYCELEDGPVEIESKFIMTHPGSEIYVKSACIANVDKRFTITCAHASPYTSGFMEHYAVVKEGGGYRMEACGKIDKGAHGSASHQATRVLTMTSMHNSEVEPVLLIDENDVKASHATTLGQPDEQQLYYLQTRGLTRAQALGLLTVGYLMPITELFDDTNLQAELKNEIETKVGLHV